MHTCLAADRDQILVASRGYVCVCVCVVEEEGGRRDKQLDKQQVPSPHRVIWQAATSFHFHFHSYSSLQLRAGAAEARCMSLLCHCRDRLSPIPMHG